LSNTRLSSDDAGSAALALAAGVDQAFCDSPYYPPVIAAGVADGSIAAADVERAAFNVLAAKFASGLFDGVLPDPALRARIYSAEHRALARRAVLESAVLLENRGALPLALARGARVAVVGPNAGCPAPPPPAPPGACATTPATDCPGDDVDKVDGITTPAACCAACASSSACVVAVLATDFPGGQCLLKSACSGRAPAANRVLCDPGKPAPAPDPWSCRAMRGQLGGYSNLEQPTDALLDNAAHVTTVLEAAVAAANASGNAFSVRFAPGAEQSGADASGVAAAAALAADSDVVVAVLGDGGEAVGYDSSVSCGEGADRPSLDLPGVQLALLDALLAAGPPVVVVLLHGRPVTFGGDYGGSAAAASAAPLNARAAAVLAAWRPGSEGGAPIWDLLTGAASPSGRLAQSWPRAVGAVRVPGISPAYIKFSDQGGEGFTLGAPFSPLYPLGHGLDYLAVTLGAPAAAVDAARQQVNVSVRVANAAPRAGAFVVQVYFSQRLSRFTRYKRMLGGFEKVAVPASGAVDVLVTLAYADMAYWDARQRSMVLDAGTYDVFACENIATCGAPVAVVVPEAVAGL